MHVEHNLKLLKLFLCQLKMIFWEWEGKNEQKIVNEHHCCNIATNLGGGVRRPRFFLTIWPTLRCHGHVIKNF